MCFCSALSHFHCLYFFVVSVTCYISFVIILFQWFRLVYVWSNLFYLQCSSCGVCSLFLSLYIHLVFFSILFFSFVFFSLPKLSSRAECLQFMSSTLDINDSFFHHYFCRFSLRPPSTFSSPTTESNPNWVFMLQFAPTHSWESRGRPCLYQEL